MKQLSAGERYAKVYNIDYSRRIFCGYCVEATYDIHALIYRKEQVLEPWPPKKPATS